MFLDSLGQCRPFRDAKARSYFAKFKNSLNEKYQQQIAPLTNEEYKEFSERYDMSQIEQDLQPGDEDTEDVKPNIGGQPLKRCVIQF